MSTDRLDVPARVDPPVTSFKYRAFISYSHHDKDVVEWLWYPWAIACARQWLAHARNAGADPERVTKVRRVLGYLVVDLKSAAIDEAKRAWPWIAAEVLYGLSEITPPRPAPIHE